MRIVTREATVISGRHIGQGPPGGRIPLEGLMGVPPGFCFRFKSISISVGDLVGVERKVSEMK